MSMLSSLRDELRNVATDVECIDDYNFVVGRDSVILTKAAMLMLRAADTIWELRNDYVKLRDENERLRMNANPTAEELRMVREAWEKDRDKLLAECQHSQRLAENLEAGEHENAKLREELEDQEGYDQMLRDRLNQQTEQCVKAEAENTKLRELVRELYDDQCCDGDQWKYRDRMRELGVEVSE